jgi:hypothetical protein
VRRITALLPALAVLVLSTPAGASWSGVAQGSAEIGADTMNNATNFTAACTNVKANSTVTLRWTISPDSYVEFYDIVRTGAGGGTNATYRLARTTAALTDTPKVGAGISYTYTIRSGSTTIAWETPLLVATGTPSYSKTACTTA